MVDSEVKSKPDSEKAYPYIGISQGEIVVLFIGPSDGFVITNNHYHNIGYYLRGGWNESNFSIFEGEVVLKNRNLKNT